MRGQNTHWRDYVRILEQEEYDLILSDNGGYVQRMLNAIDGGFGTKSYYNRRIDMAKRYCQKYARWALPVLKLIIKNESNRKESICEMVKMREYGTPQESAMIEP